MTSSSMIADLLEHMQWADSLIWRAIISSSVAAEDANLHARLYHLHLTQHAFLQVWRGQSAPLPAADSLDATALARWAQDFYSEAIPAISKFDDEALSSQVQGALLSKAEERLGPGTLAPTIGDTVIQVVLHTTYHRGQINMRLRELGYEPPLTEHFVWVWRGKPKAEWPSGA